MAKAKKEDRGRLFITAGTLIGMGVGFYIGHLVAGLFVGLGLGYLVAAIIKNK